MEYIAIILRMIFFYIFIIFIYRIMGKREVGQLGIVDLIVSILIAELVAICIENPKESIMSSIIPIKSWLNSVNFKVFTNYSFIFKS